MKGLLVRTRAKWIDDGEKPTKYFLSLEKKNYINITVTKIVNDYENLITDEQKKYFKKSNCFIKHCIRITTSN
jgi:hypothetical protein